MENPDRESCPDAMLLLSAPELDSSWHRTLDRSLRWIMEATVMILMGLLPWLGATSSTTRLLLIAGVALLSLLWAVRLLGQGKVSWHKCPVTLGLALLFLSGIWQLLPFSLPVLHDLSPATARIYQQMLPAEPEVLFEAEHSNMVLPPDLTISLNPYATRLWIMEFLVVLMLFTLVLHNFDPVTCLQRFSVVMLTSGTLLALVIFIQHAGFTCVPIDPLLQVRDPATNFYFRLEESTGYLELCLGMGWGLILYRLLPYCMRLGQVEGTARCPCSRTIPFTLAKGGAMTILLACLTYTATPRDLSRIGAAAILCWLLILPKFRMKPMVIPGIIFSGMGFMIWIERESFESLAVLWSRVLDVAQEFPRWGTGWGTFSQVASNQGFFANLDTRASGPSSLMIMLVEGGILGVLLCVFVIGMVLRLGYQAVSQPDQTAGAGLALGAVFGLMTQVLHGIFDATIPLASTGMIGAVLSAFLCGLAVRGQSKCNAFTDFRVQLPLGRVTAAAVALILLLLSVILLDHGWRVHVANRVASARLQWSPSEDPSRLQTFLPPLHAATALTPGNPNIRMEIAQVHLRLYTLKKNQLQRVHQETEIASIVQIMTGAGPPGAFVGAWNGISSGCVSDRIQDLVNQQENAIEHAHLLPAMNQWINARNLCPINPEPHLQLGKYQLYLNRADPMRVYLERARWIAPRDARVLYQCGLQELENQHLDEACEHWQASLLLYRMST